MIEIVPIKYKTLLTIDEAAEYFGLDPNRIRTISEMEEDNLVLWVGNKRMLKRRRFEEYMKENDSELFVQEGEILLWQDDREEIPIRQKIKLTENGEIKIEQYLRPESINELMEGIRTGGQTAQENEKPYMRHRSRS